MSLFRDDPSVPADDGRRAGCSVKRLLCRVLGITAWSSLIMCLTWVSRLELVDGGGLLSTFVTRDGNNNDDEDENRSYRAPAENYTRPAKAPRTRTRRNIKRLKRIRDRTSSTGTNGHGRTTASSEICHQRQARGAGKDGMVRCSGRRKVMKCCKGPFHAF